MKETEKKLLIEVLKPSNEAIDKKVIELLDRLKVSGKVYIDKDFIFVLRKPELPILVAHMDIVHNRPTLKDKYIVGNEYYIWSPLGIGGDDRCGVFALLMLSELEVNLLFTHWEERGGIGAKKFIGSAIATEIDPCYFLELDRRGMKDWVCYNCDEDNPDWAKKLEKYFVSDIGSFSDITILGSHWNVCSANLSIGFFAEHTKGEYIYTTALERTIRLVPQLLKELGHKKYALPEIDYNDYEKLDSYYWSKIVFPRKSKTHRKGHRYWLYSDYEEIERLYYEDIDEIDEIEGKKAIEYKKGDWYE